MLGNKENAGGFSVGIIGAAGYTAGELMRILLNHPMANIVWAQSESQAGLPVWQIHHDLLGETDLCFTDKGGDADVVFICSGHGKSKAVVEGQLKDFKGKIIDLSNDFRLDRDADGFVYGLPEAFRNDIIGADRIANPGCFATSIQMALLPLAKAGLLKEVHVTGITGSTGAGQKPQETTHFSWRANNMSVYKAFTHQHLGEICQTLHKMDTNWEGKINFVPVRGDFPRGIMASVYMDCDLTEDEAVELYKTYYKDEPFVWVCDFNPDMKMVVGTNKCVVYVRKYGEKIHIISMIDNLCKGASGQAVQNMNLILGLDETMGLKLKANRF